MRLLVGCPVAHRAWAIPMWMECLASQTRRPDGLVFEHSGRVGDETWTAISTEAHRHGFACRINTNDIPTHPRHDNERFRTLAGLRNTLMQSAKALGADRFLSLDTDVMLENPDAIARMEHLLDEGADLASVLTFLHPAASRADTEVDICWAYNAGWWRQDGQLDDDRRQWERPLPDQVSWGETMRIDVPMAVWMCNRPVLEKCAYRWHLSGEDLGFAQDLDRHDFLCLWDTAIRARHIWCEQDLSVPA